MAAAIGILLLSISLAANISGSFYSAYTLEAYKDAVAIEIKGGESYKAVFVENYSVDLPAGEYEISASSLNGQMSSQEERIVINNETRWDIILLYDDATDFSDPEIDYAVDVPVFAQRDEEGNDTVQNLLTFAAVLVAIAVIFIIVSHKLEKKYDEEQDYELLKDKELTNDERAFLESVMGNEGVAEQKGMRKLLGWSDAKTSLISKSMETQGFVKIVKKGRENIVKITEKGKEIIGTKPQQE